MKISIKRYDPETDAEPSWVDYSVPSGDRTTVLEANASVIREMVCNGDGGLEKLGILLDPKKNASSNGPVRSIQTDTSQVAILVIPTDEEKEIARQTVALLRLSA